MSTSLLAALAAYTPRDRVEWLIRPEVKLPSEGVALFADISGFTPLTEALTRGLSPDQGGEEVTRVLNGVFTPLIAQIEAFHGSVIKFGGDSLMVWYGRQPYMRRSAVIRCAITSAWRMQRVMKIHGQVHTPVGPVTLSMKVGLVYGTVKRFHLGQPEYGHQDILGGRTINRMSEAEHHAEPGEIVFDAETLAYLPDALTVAEWREDFAVLGKLLHPARPQPWPPLEWPPALTEILTGRLTAYVASSIYQTLATGHTQVAELKPVVSLFVQFHDLDYDSDPEIEPKLQTYFSTVQRVVARYEGRLNRFSTGDKGSMLHLLFGAPRAVEQPEVRAIRCALDLQQECGSLPFVSMQRIGVTVGRAFAGPVGSPTCHEYTVMGDSINLSARLMQHATAGQILIEAAVRARLGPEFEVADLGQIRVKGKSQPISVFAALGMQAESPRPTVQQSPQIEPIFGRDYELGLIRQQLERLSDGRGSLVMVTGEAGIGKTYLLDHLRAETETAITWGAGRSQAYGEALTGFLFINILRDLIGMPTGVDPETASQHLNRFCVDLFGQSGVEATYPYLARFMGLPLGGDIAQVAERLTGESFRWQLFEVIHEMFRLLLDHHSLALALDDVQWADPTSLQLLETILPFISDHPLIIFFVMRPEHDSRGWSLHQRLLKQWTGSPSLLELTLDSLDRAAATALVAHVAPVSQARIGSQLVDKSGGNPLFLVELVRTLQAHGLLVDQVNEDQVDLEILKLPDSVQALLLAQIDSLEVNARYTLQLASVIGQIFLVQILALLVAGEQQQGLEPSLQADAVDGDKADIAQQLAALETSRYIQRAEPTDLGPAYTFRHHLIRDSAYSTLLYARRRAYHGQVAQTLERLFPTRLVEHAARLAYHYEFATDFTQAVYYYLQAADEARLLYANTEAETLYQRVLRLLEQQGKTDQRSNPAQWAKIYLKIAQVRANTLDFEAAQEFYNLAFEILEQIDLHRPDLSNDANTQERVIRLGVMQSGPTTLDPGLSEIEEVSEIINDLFEGLAEFDNDWNIIPALARRWQIEEGGRRYRLELRRNLRWSDGAPLTAHDFVFAWRRNLHPKTEAGMAHLLFVVEGAEAFYQGQTTDPDTLAVRAVDNFTLEITLTAPTGYFPYLLANPITYPQPSHQVQAQGADWANPENLVCNGPFKITEWQPGREIRLERNPFYRGFAPGNLDRASLWFVYPDLTAFLNKQVDWCKVEDQADLPTHYPQETLLAQYLTTFFIAFACGYPPFNQPLVRQAFVHAIDRAGLAREVWANVQRPARGGVVPPGMPGHSPEIGLPFDPALARRLLRQAGFNSGTDLPILILAALPGFKTTPHYIQQNWQEYLGLKVQVIEEMADEEISNRLVQGVVHCGLMGYEADYPDPDSFLRGFFHSASPINCLGWRSEHFDQLVEQAARQTDQAARLALYHQADRLLVAEEAAAAPLYYWQGFNLLRSGFRLEGAGKIVRGSSLRLKYIRVA